MNKYNDSDSSSRYLKWIQARSVFHHGERKKFATDNVKKIVLFISDNYTDKMRTRLIITCESVRHTVDLINGECLVSMRVNV